MLVVTIVERLVVMAPPGLEVVRTADILLHLLLAVQLGLHHLRLVDNVGGKALAIKWAATNLLQQPPRTVAGLGLRSILHRDGWLDVCQDLPIVGGDDLLHVQAGRVGQLQV